MWQADTSTGVESSETNQAGAGDVITSKSLDKLNTSSLPQCLWPPNWVRW